MIIIFEKARYEYEERKQTEHQQKYLHILMYMITPEEIKISITNEVT